MATATLFWLTHRFRTPGYRARVRYLFGVDFTIGLTDGEKFAWTGCLCDERTTGCVAVTKLEWPVTVAWTDDTPYSLTGTARAHAYPKTDLRRIGTQVPWRDADPVWTAPPRRSTAQITLVRR